MGNICGGDGQCLIRKEGELSWPEEGLFPIMAWDPMPSTLYSRYPWGGSSYDLLALRGMMYVKEAGINTVILGGTFEQMDGLVKAAANKDVQLSVILKPSWLYMSPNCCLSVYNHISKDGEIEYKTNSSIKGWCVQDEPKYWEWGDVAAGGDHIWNQLTLGYGILSSLDPNRLTFFNLAGVEYNDKEAPGQDGHDLSKPHIAQVYNTLGSFSQYPDYLDRLQKLFVPNVWSYDVYAMRFKQDSLVMVPATPQNTYVEYDRFYKFLGIYLDQSRKTGNPFWAFASCQENLSYKNGSATAGRPAPNAAMLKFAVFSALAFGAQGIVYWRFGQGSTTYNDNHVVISELEYGEAPLKWDSNQETNSNKGFEKTSVWEAVKNANTYINFWKQVFLGCKVLAYGHAGITYANQPLISSLACIQQIVTGDAGVLVSWFINEVKIPDENNLITRNHIAIVNHDPYNTQTVTVRLDPAAKAQFMLSISDTEATSEESSPANVKPDPGISPTLPTVISKTLTPGGMEVLYWDTEIDYNIP